MSPPSVALPSPAWESAGGPQIVSASRRTDIVAFYLPWFVARLRAGYVRCPQPFTGRIQTVSLRCQDVHSIVFWTKNGAPLLAYLDELERLGHACVCHFTITGLPPALEPGVPPWPAAVRAFVALARRWGPQRVWWRFDPILLGGDQTATAYRQRFATLAAALEGHTERCYFSFATLYAKVRRRLAAAGLAVAEPSLAERQALAQELAALAAARGMQLLSCCGDELVGGRIGKARCIDAGLLASLFPDRPLRAAVRPTRPGCGCSASRDIGMYDTCPHRCLYCYANQDGARVLARHRQHDAEADMLVPAAADQRGEPARVDQPAQIPGPAHQDLPR